MPRKSTANLENELRSCDSLDTFLQENRDELSTDSLTVQLQTLIASKRMTKTDVVKASNLNEVYAYQILSGARRPSRDKLLCLCFAMKATLEETQFLLREGRFPPLYVRDQRDSIILYALAHGYTILQLNSDLYDHGQPLVE
ncbi:MAG: XRE family transcriptional regulator [Firmicutes bacterium]|nr:XRE family transcriptional regulator [Bacillota bacterium]MDY5857296.1 hypothetical protein [Anaerovoracaceae bacterium]